VFSPLLLIVGVIMMRILIAAVLLCFSCNISYAKYCVKLPTCEELGYVFAASPNRRQILCPFDTDYALYLDYCQAYGLSAKPDGDAGDYQECIETKKDGTQINSGYYRYIRCNPGYTYKSGNCIENTCDGFNSETDVILGCSVPELCQKGKDKVYKCGECSDEYILSEGKCFKTCTTVSDCVIGDIYKYRNTPIGVVYYSDGYTTKIVALTNVDASGTPNNKSLRWLGTNMTNYAYSVPNVTKAASASSAQQDMEGKNNTDALLAVSTAGEYATPAATATSLYAPTICSNDNYCGIGKWYLPAAGELYTMYSNLVNIDNALTVVNGTTLLSTNNYWSSTQNIPSNSYRITFSNGKLASIGNYGGCYVRPSLIIGSNTNEENTDNNCEYGYESDGNGDCISIACTVAGTCSVGDIYKYNGTAIGVVFYDDGNTTKIVGLNNINANGGSDNAELMWLGSNDTNFNFAVPNITVAGEENEALNDINGRKNTDAILAFSKSDGHKTEAATATSLYAPSACVTDSICAKGKWYLPALGELAAIYENLNNVDEALNKAGGIILNHDSYYYIWSSTEYNDSGAWRFNFSNGNVGADPKYGGWGYVRPILSF